MSSHNNDNQPLSSSSSRDTSAAASARRLAAARRRQRGGTGEVDGTNLTASVASDTATNSGSASSNRFLTMDTTVTPKEGDTDPAASIFSVSSTATFASSRGQVLDMSRSATKTNPTATVPRSSGVSSSTSTSKAHAMLSSNASSVVGVVDSSTQSSSAMTTNASTTTTATTQPRLRPPTALPHSSTTSSSSSPGMMNIIDVVKPSATATTAAKGGDSISDFVAISKTTSAYHPANKNSDRPPPYSTATATASTARSSVSFTAAVANTNNTASTILDGDDDVTSAPITTIEDREPRSASFLSVPLDAACLISGSKIQILACSSSSSSSFLYAGALQRQPQQQQPQPLDEHAVDLNGFALGGENETWEIVLVKHDQQQQPKSERSSTGSSSSRRLEKGNSNLSNSHRAIRFGDTVVLLQQQTASEDGRATTIRHALSIRHQRRRRSAAAAAVVVEEEGDEFMGRSSAREQQQQVHLELQPYLAPFATAGGDGSTAALVEQQQQWVVIRGLLGRDGLVRIGESSLASSAANKTAAAEVANQRRYKQQHQNRVTSNASATATAPVRSGDVVLLRNCYNGGVLASSSRGDGTLVLVTDSYNGNVNRSGLYENDTSLMGRLQRHDLFVPSERELFCLFASTVPCPPPAPAALQDSGGVNILLQRSFQNGSYLFHSNRHQIDPLLDLSIFKSTRRGVGSFEYSDQMETKRKEMLMQPLGQELILLDEILGSFVGLEGRFIKAAAVSQPGKQIVVFRLEDDPNNSSSSSSPVSFDPSLRNLLGEILPLSTSYANVRYFIGAHLPGYEYGTVMQALCEKLDTLLEEYVTFIGGLERRYRQDVLLQVASCTAMSVLRNLQVDVRSTTQIMRILHQVVDAVRYETGGALLNALERLKLRLDGDLVASELLSLLLDAAAAPYMAMFCRWIERGELDDHHGEFMVRIDAQARRWEKRYSIVNKHALSRFFASDAALAKVVSAGRYWNAVRECRKRSIISPEEPSASGPLKFTSNVSDVSSIIQIMHRKASRTLVELLLGDFSLLSSLRLTKQYFLLDQGDFFANFMDTAESELLKAVSSISLGRIQHWLTSAVQLTEHQGESGSPVGFGTRIRSHPILSPSGILSRFSSEGLIDHLDKLHVPNDGDVSHESASTSPPHTDGGTPVTDVTTGLDVFVVDFASIPFPASLVLTPTAMASYQLLFRHLFYTKFVERRLVGIWQDHQALRELQSLRGPLGPTFLLRQRMLHLVQNLIYYMMLEVVEPNWIEFENAIASAEARKEQTADGICTAHANFLHKTLEACLLTHRDVLRSLKKLLGTCLLFTNEMKRFMKATKLEDDRHSVAKEKRKTIRQTLNDRGGSSRPSLSSKAAGKLLVNSIAERNERVIQQTERVSRELSSDSYRQMITRFGQVFLDNLCDFMLQLKYADGLHQPHKLNLCTRLDYNGFVSSALGLSSKKANRGGLSTDGNG